MKRKKITELPLTQVAEMYGKGSLDASQEETPPQILETVITELSNLVLQLGDLSAELDCLVIKAMMFKRNLQLSYRQEVDGSPGQVVRDASD